MPRLSRPAAFWSTAGLLILLLAASGAPSPLYRVYQARFGFGAGLLTTVFGIYALALLAALLVVGSLSDHVGRRPVLAAGMRWRPPRWCCSVAADSVGWLLAARVVQGLSTGAAHRHARRRARGHDRAASARSGRWSTAWPRARSRARRARLRRARGVRRRAHATGSSALLTVASSSAPRPWWPCCRRGRRGCPGARASLRPPVRVPAVPAAPRRLPLVPMLVASWALGGLYLSLGPSLAAGVFGAQQPRRRAAWS